MEKRHGCGRCGYPLDVGSPEYCLPCTARMAISAMRGIPVPPLHHVAPAAHTSVEQHSAAKAIEPVRKIKKEKTPSRKKEVKRSKKKNFKVGSPTSSAPSRPARSVASSGYICCFLCGEQVRKGELLAHKISVHGELPPKPQKRRVSNRTWVSIVQGGLPSLGKRR